MVALLLATILIPVGWDVEGPTLPTSIFLSTCVSIYASMGLWLGFGRSTLRLIAISTVTLAITALMWLNIGGPPGLQLFLLFLLLAVIVIAVVAGPIVVVRVVRRGRLDIVQENSEPAEALQFRIAHLFVLTTVVAVLTLLAKALWPHIQELGGENQWILIGKLGCTLGVCSLVVVWSTLGRDALMRTVVSALVTAGLASLNYWIIRSEIGWLWLTMTLLVWGQTMVLMWLIRIEGFRFVTETIRIGESS